MKKKTKVILLLAISLITLSIGINKKYLVVYGSFTSTNENGQLVERGYHLDEWIEILEEMEGIQKIHSSAFGDNFSSGLDEMKRINLMCYFLIITSIITFIFMLLVALLLKEDVDIKQELNENSRA